LISPCPGGKQAFDTTFARQKQATALLKTQFVKHPDHTRLAHYNIHANDTPHQA
jgi:hypothetical protein